MCIRRGTQSSENACTITLPSPLSPLPAGQTPLLSIALHQYNGNFRVVNLGLIGAGLPLLVAPLLLSRYFNQVRKPKQGDAAGIN